VNFSFFLSLKKRRARGARRSPRRCLCGDAPCLYDNLEL